MLIAKGRWTEGKGGCGEWERSGDEAEAGSAEREDERIETFSPLSFLFD